jgi:hypothetical protein
MSSENNLSGNAIDRNPAAGESIDAVQEALRIQEEFALEQGETIETLKGQIAAMQQANAYDMTALDSPRDYTGNTPSDHRFVMHGKQWCFTVPAFIINGTRYTSSQALEDVTILRKLVDMKSAAIKVFSDLK